MAAGSAKILIVDDEETIRNVLTTVLEREGFVCKPVASGEAAIEEFDADPYDIVITDIHMPGKSGVDVMRHVKAVAADTIVLLITAHGSLETAIEAVREGAADYLTKPVRFENIIMKVRNLLRIRELEWENRVLRIEKHPESYFDELVGDSEVIGEIKRNVLKIATAPGNVLIEGESGTGKELVARAIHAASQDRNGAFVPVNCGAIPESLLESEFFGFKKGAFTGADRDQEGLFREARYGTLFLDEVAEISTFLQPKILRAIETKEIRPLGASKAVPVNIRIVAATNRNLGQMVENGTFREDLFFRLNVFRITVPPLRERIEDIPVLAVRFLNHYRIEMKSPVEEISADALAVLQTYPWKGNARELQNVIQRALITAERPILDAATFERLLGMRIKQDRNLKNALRDFEYRHIERVIEESNGDKRLAADRLRISLASLYSKIKR